MGIEISLHYNGNELLFLRRKFENTIDRFVDIGAEKIEDAIAKEAPTQSGDLRRSYESRHTGRFTAKAYSNLHYAQLVNDGRGPIEAPPGGSLHFRMNGQMIHVKRVGPAEPNPYIERGMKRANAFEDYFAQAKREVGL